MLSVHGPPTSCSRDPPVFATGMLSREESPSVREGQCRRLSTSTCHRDQSPVECSTAGPAPGIRRWSLALGPCFWSTGVARSSLLSGCSVVSRGGIPAGPPGKRAPEERRANEEVEPSWRRAPLPEAAERRHLLGRSGFEACWPRATSTCDRAAARGRATVGLSSRPRGSAPPESKLVPIGGCGVDRTGFGEGAASPARRREDVARRRTGLWCWRPWPRAARAFEECGESRPERAPARVRVRGSARWILTIASSAVWWRRGP